MRNDKMVFAAFASASTTYGEIGAWTHPATDLGITEADYYINLARVLERSGFDILFFDDRLAMPDIFGHSVGITARLGARAVKLDLMTILGLLSAHTSRIGLGATYSTTYHAPYHVARAFATLDHLSGGRAIWNIVTSLNDTEAENFGTEYQNPDQRYDRADEFLEIVTQLWESWEADALRMDRATGVYADPEKVHAISFHGKYLSSKGPLTVPQPPQGWPILLQAGQSGRGMEFAARWADLIFTAPRDLEAAKDHYRAHADGLASAGRPKGSTRILPAIQVIVGETAEIAEARRTFVTSLASPEEALVALSEQANYDFSVFPMDDPLPDDIIDRVQGARGLVQKFLEVAKGTFGPVITLRQLGESLTKNLLPRVVGDPVQVADQLAEWFENHACDGFALLPSSDPGSFEDFGRLVMPELRRRGLVADIESGRETVRNRLGLPWRASR